jgi:hypothetical protein
MDGPTEDAHTPPLPSREVGAIAALLKQLAPSTMQQVYAREQEYERHRLERSDSTGSGR